MKGTLGVFVFPGGSVIKNLPAKLEVRVQSLVGGGAGRMLGRSPEEGNGYPLQYSGLENSTDREAWQATVHGVTKELDMT